MGRPPGRFVDNEQTVEAIRNQHARISG
jgi:hypothetical protein